MNKISKFNKILAVVLVAQLVLLAAQALWPEGESRASGEALLASFDPDAVTGLTIADSGGKQIVLAKDGDTWVLPDYGNYPAETTRVMLLLDNIQSLRADRLITRSTTSHRRLKVSADEYERLITLTAGDTTHQLYLGTISGGSTLHARLDDQAQVYLVSGIAASDAGTLPSSWVDTLYFSAPSDEVTSFVLHNATGDLAFTKDGNTWTMAGLGADETLDQVAVASLLGQVTALRMTEPLGTEVQDTYGMDAPQATITLHVREQVAAPTRTPDLSTGALMTATPDPSATLAPTPEPQYAENEYTVQIGAALEDGVVVKASTSDFYVVMAATAADRLTQMTRDALIAPPPTATPEPTLSADEDATATAMPMSVPTAAETPAAPPAPELTPTPEPTATGEPAGGS